MVLASIQLLKDVGYPDHFSKSSVLLLRQRRMDSIRYDDILEFRLVECTVQFITVSIDQTMHGWIGSVRVNNDKQFAMYPFSKCRFALLMRTRSPTPNLGVPPLS